MIGEQQVARTYINPYPYLFWVLCIKYKANNMLRKMIEIQKSCFGRIFSKIPFNGDEIGTLADLFEISVVEIRFTYAFRHIDNER